MQLADFSSVMLPCEVFFEPPSLTILSCLVSRDPCFLTSCSLQPKNYEFSHLCIYSCATHSARILQVQRSFLAVEQSYILLLPSFPFLVIPDHYFEHAQKAGVLLAFLVAC